MLVIVAPFDALPTRIHASRKLISRKSSRSSSDSQAHYWPPGNRRRVWPRRLPVITSTSKLIAALWLRPSIAFSRVDTRGRGSGHTG